MYTGAVSPSRTGRVIKITINNCVYTGAVSPSRTGRVIKITINNCVYTGAVSSSQHPAHVVRSVLLK